SAYRNQPKTEHPDCGGAKLPQDEKEELQLELIPSVADKNQRGRRKAEWEAANPPVPPAPAEPEKPERYATAFWEELPLHAGG
ncbi:MAG: hypothetical protein Q8M76_14230, partial [Spirochaetaceae bacterium]|nr:hypothetical protein [Spirochaetaceae bacterium]